jgi:hypothetical protein
MAKTGRKAVRGACWMASLLLAAGPAFAVGAAEVTLTNQVPSPEGRQAGPQASMSLAGGSDQWAGILDRVDVEQSIRDIYQRFADAARASGDGIRFEISNVTTYRPSQFDEILWLSLFTLPDGLVIQTIPSQRAGALPSEDVVTFRSAWEPAEKTFEGAQELTKAIPLLTAASALDQLAEWNPARLRGVVAASSFDVRVQFAGRNRAYRAMVLWKPLSSDALLFTLVDHVVPGVDLAFSENRPVVTHEEFDSGIGGPELAPRFGCISTFFDLYSNILTVTGFQYHTTGNHSGSLRLGRTCQTTVGCSSYCTPYQAYSNCSDWGSVSNPLYPHYMFYSAAVDSIDGYGAGVASQCGYALGCAVKECFLAICGGGVNFGVSGYGGSIALRAVSSVLGDLSVHQGGNCPGAESADPPCHHCCESANQVITMSLRGGGEPIQLPSAEIPLTRHERSDVMHHGQQVSYLMGEWALVSYTSDEQQGASSAILAQSSPAFSEARAAEVSTTLAAELSTRGAAAGGKQVALMVAVPSHEANSRYIPMPDFKVAAGRPPAGSQRGEVLVRADFSEDHHLQDLRILYDDLGGVSRDLALYIERAISLNAPPDELHRVVVFALLSVGDSLGIESTISYLPKCCCGGEPCI